ncbi:MAG: Alanine racemase [Phycisphaerales bacterium]|nr:Alanine racemase [Phycisphaerales bacterium]
MTSPHVNVTIDLSRVRQNAEEVAARVGVPVWATIKADAYGLGAGRVAAALAGVDGVAGFCVFALEEAEAVGLWELTGKPAIALGPPSTLDVGRWLAAHVRPAVSTVAQALALAGASPVLCVDTGMQRFACAAADVGAVMEAGGIDEAFTHATRVEHVRRLREATAGRTVRLHAAATGLLEEPEARLDAVRPGLALYRGAVRTSARLADVRRSAGAIGYGGWRSESGFHGVILAGYSHGLRLGPVMVNGQRQRITEIGMQSAYVTLDEGDRMGDEVVLLGEGLSEAEVAFAWEATPHQVVLVMAGMGERGYVG